MTVEDCRAFLATQGRDTVLATIVDLLQLVHGMDKSGMVPEQHGNALTALGRVRDLSGLEMSEHAAELNKSEACVDWGSVSTDTNATSPQVRLPICFTLANSSPTCQKHSLP